MQTYCQNVWQGTTGSKRLLQVWERNLTASGRRKSAARRELRAALPWDYARPLAGRSMTAAETRDSPRDERYDVSARCLSQPPRPVIFPRHLLLCRHAPFISSRSLAHLNYHQQAFFFSFSFLFSSNNDLSREAWVTNNCRKRFSFIFLFLHSITTSVDD